MLITNQKITKVSTSINWSRSLKDDAGRQFALLTATIDESRPFGTTALTVFNQKLFKTHEAEAQAAYAAFQEEVAATAAATQTVVTEEVDE